MFYIFIIIILFVLYFVFTSYNKLQRSAQQIKAALSNISVSLQKKVNLVNQLIDIVKNYQDGEQLLHLTISKNATQSEVATNQHEANRALIGVQGFIQRFPELKANEQYNHLMHSIDKIENEVSHQREKYNEAVREYNSLRSTVPTVFIASLLKFPEAPYLDFTQENIEQTILKDFNTNSGEHLNALLDSTKNNLIQGSKTMINKAVETSKKIGENEAIQDLRHKSMEKIAELKAKPKLDHTHSPEIEIPSNKDKANL